MGVLKIPAYKLITASGRLQRKDVKRVKAYLYFEGEGAEKRSLHDAVVFADSETKTFVFRRERYRVRATQSPILLLNKPAGYVTSRSLEEGANIFDCFGDVLLARYGEELQPVGRLDRDTEGVLLLTTDGTLSHRLTHPKRAIERVYVARLGMALDPERLALLRKGELVLRDGHRPTVSAIEQYPEDQPVPCPPCPPEIQHEAGSGLWRVALAEGKYHEVRRMCAACGGRLDQLWRVSYAGVTLKEPQGDGWLKVGQWRRLEEVEVSAVRTAVGLDTELSWVDVECLGAVPDFEPPDREV
jgi:16S rRNA pseudouridine516 synthase